MSNLVRFETVDNELNILRIGGKSFLPPDVEWPTNPNGEKMVFIFNIPTNFLNSTLQFNYPKDQVISVFTTYNREDYFLDSIVYNGDIEELQNIKNGYTKVILHSVASPRNDADFLISAREIVIDKDLYEISLNNDEYVNNCLEYCKTIPYEYKVKQFIDVYNKYLKGR